MSVLFKGMDMPERGCYKCWAREGNWCSLLPDVPYREIITCAWDEKRHDDCPLEDGTPYEMLINCKDCSHFHYDYWDDVNGIPLIVGHEICDFWGNGCKTSEDAFCSFVERRTDE